MDAEVVECIQSRAREVVKRLEGMPCEEQAVSYINVGVFHVFDEAGVEVHCGGHPSVELPGYSPMDPELNASYPYCYPLPSEQPPAYEEIYPGEPCAHGT
ncbi:hypothetical protein TURU_113037 [Turdus rufiventris]|nr:hypothetical protein TURU_113037 [Turdus rufiventris]